MDNIYCLSVNDFFVMKSWAKAQGVCTLLLLCLNILIHIYNFSFNYIVLYDGACSSGTKLPSFAMGMGSGLKRRTCTWTCQSTAWESGLNGKFLRIAKVNISYYQILTELHFHRIPPLWGVADSLPLLKTTK